LPTKHNLIVILTAAMKITEMNWKMAC